MINRRQNSRWKLNVVSRLRLEGAQNFAECVINDINFKGLKICLSLKLPRDTFLKFTLSLSEELSFDFEAWVAWHKSVEGCNLYGLYFTKIKDADREAIYGFVRKNFPQQLNAQWWKGAKEGGEMMEEQKFEDRRIFGRFAAKLPARFINLTDNKEADADIEDLSAKGVGFQTQEDLRPRTQLEMWLKIPDKGEPLYARGEVVWSKAVEPRKYRVGVSLERADLMGLSRVLRVLRVA